MKLRYVAQDPQLEMDKTVRENLLTAIKPILDMSNDTTKFPHSSRAAVDEKMNKLMEELAVLSG
jgi:ATPase subunit of ABC transporter with duplicated ATPase domains